MSFLDSSSAEATQLPKLEGPPPPVLAPQGKKPKAQSNRTTFLGSDATPGPASGNFGGKTLLGSMG